MQIAAEPALRSSEVDGVNGSCEARFSRDVPAEHRRQFGQVFTPLQLAALMADWVMGHAPRSLLDPAYGTGVLAAACLAVDSSLDVTAYEIDSRVLEYAREVPANVRIRNRDFLQDDIRERYDSVIMNPPYIRHREISDNDKALSSVAIMSGVAIPKSANLYIYFAVKAIELLRPNGRAAILIPAEWMSANFSRTFKRYLLDRSFLKGIVTFSNCSNIFDDALTTASVVLCER